MDLRPTYPSPMLVVKRLRVSLSGITKGTAGVGPTKTQRERKGAAAGGAHRCWLKVASKIRDNTVGHFT